MNYVFYMKLVDASWYVQLAHEASRGSERSPSLSTLAQRSLLAF